jgi:hypothetical protein
MPQVLVRTAAGSLGPVFDPSYHMSSIVLDRRWKGRNEMDMPPIDMEAASPRPSGGPGSLVPASIILTAAGRLVLRPMEGSTAEEREIVGRIVLTQWLAVEPGFIPEIVEPVPAATQQ